MKYGHFPHMNETHKYDFTNEVETDFQIKRHVDIGTFYLVLPEGYTYVDGYGEIFLVDIKGEAIAVLTDMKLEFFLND
jgi:hypothetical protein